MRQVSACRGWGLPRGLCPAARSAQGAPEWLGTQCVCPRHSALLVGQQTAESDGCVGNDGVKMPLCNLHGLQDRVDSEVVPLVNIAPLTIPPSLHRTPAYEMLSMGSGSRQV